MTSKKKTRNLENKMKILKRYESYNKDWVITVKISEDTMKEAYWEVYYPVTKEEVVAGEEDDMEVMDYDDFVEGTLDGVWGDICLFLNREMNFNVDYDYKDMRNMGINIEYKSMNFKTNLVPTKQDITNLDNFLNENLSQYLNNSVKSVSNISWSIYVNGTHFNTTGSTEKQVDYSSMSQKEIQDLVDQALDNRDFDTVKMLSQYLKESKILRYTQFLKS
jgi:ferritin